MKPQERAGIERALVQLRLAREMSNREMVMDITPETICMEGTGPAHAPFAAGTINSRLKYAIKDLEELL